MRGSIRGRVRLALGAAGLVVVGIVLFATHEVGDAAQLALLVILWVTADVARGRTLARLDDGGQPEPVGGREPANPHHNGYRGPNAHSGREHN